MAETASPTQRQGPPAITLLALFGKFLRFGCLAFGGPVAQIAMLRAQFVDKEGWISSARFNRLLAVMQALPGPEAHELCVHLGMIARGRIGGLLAGLGFMLPGLLLMLACAAAYTAFVEGDPGLAGVLLGVQVAVLAVIARSVEKIGRHILHHWLLGAIAAIALAATLAGVPFWAPLVAGAYACGRARHKPAAGLAVAVLIVTAAALLLPEEQTSVVIAGVEASEAALPLALFMAGLKGGLLTFGGAYTAIPYVREDTVGRGWLSDGAFLDGVAVANLLPAPLVIFATFAGHVAGGLPGALAITAGMFLPAFAFSLIFFERLEEIATHPRLAATLDGVAAAAVGVMAATLVQLALSAAARIEAVVPAAAILGLAIVAAWRFKGAWVAPAVVALGAIAGAMVLA